MNKNILLKKKIKEGIWSIIVVKQYKRFIQKYLQKNKSIIIIDIKIHYFFLHYMQLNQKI